MPPPRSRASRVQTPSPMLTLSNAANTNPPPPFLTTIICLLVMSLLLVLNLVLVAAAAASANNCGDERCGHLKLPFPFHLNASCGPAIDAFRLSCNNNNNNSALYLTIGGSADLRVVNFLPSGSLVIDYSPNSSSTCDRWYVDVNRSFPFLNSSFYALTARNVFRLYDCEDSSVCKPGCDGVAGRSAGGCEAGSGVGGYSGCCYPLSDGSAWKAGEGFGVFAEFGCRGFSSWAVTGTAGVAERGIEIEWAVPRGYRDGAVCAEGAVAVNSTGVAGGVRCACVAGMVGDGFAEGAACFKTCSNNGSTTDNTECCKGRVCKKKVAVLAGVLVSAFILTAAMIFYILLRRPVNKDRWDMDPACLPRILGKGVCTRLFTFQELNEAKKKVEDGQKFDEIIDGSVHTGILDDGTLVAIQKVQSETQYNFRQVLERVEILSRISHKNIARIVGCCVSSSYSLLLVHEFFSNETVEELLQRSRGGGFSWYHRINIAAEVANALLYLQYEISPPIYLHDIKSRDIYIDSDYSVKISSLKFLNSRLGNESGSYVVSHDSEVVNRFGIILLELIMGSRPEHHPEIVLHKINDRKFHEIVDPYLDFSGQLPFQREQIEKVARFAIQCLSSRDGGWICMAGVVKELVRIAKDSLSSSSWVEPALEVTFSNSSLLQMISMSPDSIHVPPKVL